MNFLLYSAAVLVFGSAWLGIKYQLGVVAPEVSVAYRFVIAAAILFLYCLAARLAMRFTLREHAFMALQGLLLFSVNQFLIYLGTQYLASGLVAVAFSTIVVMNIGNGALIFRTSVPGRVTVGAALGLVGITCVFWPEVRAFDLSRGGTLGLVLVLAGTYLASLGNMAAMRNQARGLPVMQCMTYAMAYGALFTVFIALARGQPFIFDPSLKYSLSLVYVAVITTAFGFWCYLTLLGRIGAARTAYSAVLYPIVALALSTAFEGFRWTVLTVVGLVFILGGNILVLTRTDGAMTGAAPKGSI
ncbi:MAG: DMT family transporter [Rhodospirillales bacterium]|jgi:drug/metabolite transporter (DMT)-like permease|nr:DMT family transporter [Rhodospirillales bacterium]MDP6883393.1 DMT family transporter [Rhodospirillales bacterium]